MKTPAIETPQTMATQTTIAPKLTVSKSIEPSMMTVQPQYSAQDSAPQILAKKPTQTAAEPAIEPATSDSELQVLKQKQESLQQEVDLLRKRINQGVQKTEIKPHPDLPEGLQIYSEALFLTPRTNLSTDFASTTPGLNPLIGATLSTQDYRGSTGWRVGARYRFERSPWEVGASITRFGSDSTATIVPPVGGTLSATQFGPTAIPVTQAIGLDWSTKIGQSGKFMAGVGYEYQHLFNASRSIRPNGVGGFSENRGDLSMPGFFAKAGFRWSF